jgi:hypothetical protein
MVTFNNDNRFYVRHGNMTALMDVGEVRTAFASAESLPERLRSLRLNRIDAIASGDVARPLSNPEALVFHLIPVKSLDPLYECDLEAFVTLERANRCYLPTTYETEGRGYLEFDFDSVQTLCGQDDGCAGYTKLFRTGVLEVVDSLRLQRRERIGGGFLAGSYEKELFELLPRWLETLKIVKAEPPVLIALSFIGMAGRFPYLDPARHNVYKQARPIRQDPLLIRAKFIESLDATSGVALLPIFNYVWQCCGKPGTVNFDAAGNWIGKG